MLAENWRRKPIVGRRRRQPNGICDDGDVLTGGVMHRANDVSRFDLRIFEHVAQGIDRSAADRLLFELLHPPSGWMRAHYPLERLGDECSILDTSRIRGKALIL